MPTPQPSKPNISIHRTPWTQVAPTLSSPTSWWASAPRERWSSIVEQEQRRLIYTRFGKNALTNLVLGSGSHERQQGLIEGYRAIRRHTLAGDGE
jgi:hypothetical protein